MQPLVRAALAVGVLVVVSGLATERVVRRGRDAPAEVASGASEPIRMPCGPREIPEGTACVPIPQVAPGGSSAAVAADDEAIAEDVDVALGLRIPRRPDRPADVMKLQLPIADAPRLLDVPGAVVVGSDVDRSVLRLGAPRGAPVIAPLLRGQDGAAEVLGIERMAGRGLVVAALATTRGGDDDGGKGAKRPGGAKDAKDAGGAKDVGGAKTGEERWLLLFGSLDGAGPGLAKGSKLAAGAVVGFTGDAISPGEPHARFEARRLRESATPGSATLAQLVSDAESVAVDARNILAPR